MASKWVIRRAANHTRSFNCRISHAHSCLDKITLGIGNNPYFLKSCSNEPSSKPSLLWTQGFSSQTGTKFSDHEGEIDEVVSVQEMVEDVSECNGESELDEDKVKEKGGDEGLEEGEAESNEEGWIRKRRAESPLLKMLMKTPRNSMKSALDKWVKDGNPIGRVEFSDAAFSLRKRGFFGKALEFFEWLETNKRLDFIEQDYASHLDLVAKLYGLQNAEKYIQNIPESFRGEEIYRTLLANCVISTNVKKAEEVFNRMRGLGFPVTTFACNQLLLLYRKFDRKKIVEVLALMEKENVKLSLLSYSLLIDAKGSVNDIFGMEQVMETMKAEDIEPDFRILAMIAKYYISGGLKDKAEAIMKGMEGGNIKENRNACELLLPLYASLGKADDVARIWKFCESKFRLGECLAAIEAFGKLGRIEDAEEVFKNITKKPNKVYSKYYDALLKVYTNNKLFKKGEELAKRMSDDRCRIGPTTWDVLVNLYVSAGEVEKADSILHKVIQQDRGKPMYRTYTAILSKYAIKGDIHNAEKIFLRLQQNGYGGRMSHYKLLLQTYVHAKAPAYGFRERMKADNLVPTRSMDFQLASIDAFKKTRVSALPD